MSQQSLFSTPEMEAIFSLEAHVERMLMFEAALARAEAKAGVIPQEAADAIEAACMGGTFDVERIFAEAAVAGTPVIPLLEMLIDQLGDDYEDYIHWGATSQDVIDTAYMLQMRAGLMSLEVGLLEVCAAAARLAEQHRNTLMAGRTLLQQALPITFGLKAARWLAMAAGQVQAVRRCYAQSIGLQFGGAVGTLAALGDKGLEVAEALAQDLDLALPRLPWHTERIRVAEVASMMGTTAGAMSKIAGDIVLLAQTEVGEVGEEPAPGKGGSSAMPQKKNPVDATMARAAARLAVGQMSIIISAVEQEHERAAGAWQAEWQAVPDLFRYAGGAVARVGSALKGLQVDPDRMLANMRQGGGLLMSEALMVALTPHVGRKEAQLLAREAGAEAVKKWIDLGEAAAGDERIAAVMGLDALRKALDPARYLGSANVFIDRALTSYRALQRSDDA